jgi:hypothetical protein
VPKPEAVIAYRGVKKPPLVLDLGTSGQFHCLASSPTEYENGWPQSLSEDSSEEIVSAWNRTSVVLWKWILDIQSNGENFMWRNFIIYTLHILPWAELV